MKFSIYLQSEVMGFKNGSISVKVDIMKSDKLNLKKID